MNTPFDETPLCLACENDAHSECVTGKPCGCPCALPDPYELAEIEAWVARIPEIMEGR